MGQIIKAAVVREAGAPMTLEELVLEDPRDDEILVRLVATGICHTDLVVAGGFTATPRPVVLGHEGAGVVEKVGAAVSKVAVGDHIVMSYDSCGECHNCADHHQPYCSSFVPMNFLASRLDGTGTMTTPAGDAVNANFFGQSSFATMALCREANAVKVDPSVDLSLLGPLGCGIQTGAGTVMNALKLEEGSSFAVFGSGSVGMAAIMAAKICGATTRIAVDLNEDRLAMAKELGATHTFLATSETLIEDIRSTTGRGLSAALDTTGLPPVIKQAVQTLAPRGTCAVLGAPMPGSEIAVDNLDFMTSGKRLMGVMLGESQPDTFIPHLIELWKAGSFPFDKLIRKYPFENINDAVADTHAGITIKPILTMG